jgi:metaxin
LSESKTGWFFGAESPGVFDATLFSYTHLMMEYMAGESAVEPGRALGRMVQEAGDGELVRHRERLLEVAWPDGVATKR